MKKTHRYMKPKARLGQDLGATGNSVNVFTIIIIIIII